MPERDRRSPLPADARAIAAADTRLATALQRCAAGNLTAFHELYELAAPRMLGALLLSLGDRDTAELALQDSLLRIWQQARAFNPANMNADEWLQRFLPPLTQDYCPPVRPDESSLEKTLARIEALRPQRRQANPRRWWLLCALVLGLALLLLFRARR